MTETIEQAVDLDAVLAKDGKDMTVPEIMALAEACQEQTRAVLTNGKWACRKANGSRTQTRPDAVLQAEARDIVLAVLETVEPLHKQIATLQKSVGDLTGELNEAKEMAEKLIVERNLAQEQLDDARKALNGIAACENTKEAPENVVDVETDGE